MGIILLPFHLIYALLRLVIHLIISFVSHLFRLIGKGLFLFFSSLDDIVLFIPNLVMRIFYGKKENLKQD